MIMKCIEATIYPRSGFPQMVVKHIVREPCLKCPNNSGLGILIVICPDSVSYRVVDFLVVDLALETVDLSNIISINVQIYKRNLLKYSM